MAFSHDPGPRSSIEIGDLTINHGGLMGFNGDMLWDIVHKCSQTEYDLALSMAIFVGRFMMV